MLRSADHDLGLVVDVAQRAIGEGDRSQALGKSGKSRHVGIGGDGAVPGIMAIADRTLGGVILHHNAGLVGRIEDVPQAQHHRVAGRGAVLIQDHQLTAAAAIVKSDLSVRQTEQLVKKLTTEKKEKTSKKEGEVDYAAEAQKELSNHLGRGVKIVSGKKKGRIELEYYGMDDLNDLLDALALLKIRKDR